MESQEENRTEEILTNKVISPVIKTRPQSTVKTLRWLCYICSEQRETADNSYNCTGFGRFESESSKTKPQE